MTKKKHRVRDLLFGAPAAETMAAPAPEVNPREDPDRLAMYEAKVRELLYENTRLNGANKRMAFAIREAYHELRLIENPTWAPEDEARP